MPDRNGVLKSAVSPQSKAEADQVDSADAFHLIQFSKTAGPTSAQVPRYCGCCGTAKPRWPHISTGPYICDRCLWRLAHIRLASRASSVQAVTATSGPAIDRRHRSRQRRRDSRLGPQTFGRGAEAQCFRGLAGETWRAIARGPAATRPSSPRPSPILQRPLPHSPLAADVTAGVVDSTHPSRAMASVGPGTHPDRQLHPTTRPGSVPPPPERRNQNPPIRTGTTLRMTQAPPRTSARRSAPAPQAPPPS